ncbi:MAG: peptide ABC transporter substrate-binding protein [Chloroflexota bacterium]|nr:peptide ABC transporter substrate-binding protein [Chloroflexota bacterium]
MKTKSLTILALLLIASMVLTACGTDAVETVIVEIEGETVVVTAVPDAPVEKKIMNLNWGAEPPTADPALATDTTSVDLDGQLFMGLTNFAVDGEIIPWLATDWSVSDDGLTWTFNMRDDIPWVAYNTGTAEVDLVYDADGNQRFVNALDVVYATKRTINPETASDYAYVLYIIKNAQDVNTGAEGVTVDDIGVEAIDDTTVAFTLESPAGFFPAIAGMWVAAPVPQWTIEAAGDKWTEPGTMVSNGPYVMTEWIHGSELNLAKNPYWPEADTVDIDEIHGVMIVEASTAFAMYENDELHTAGVPSAEIDRVKADPVLSLEYYSAPAACTYYYGMVNNKAPFDDVRVRKAFSMTVDKVSLVENVTKGGQIPAGFFAPPGIFGRPDDDSGVGLDYDVAAANALLDEYLADEGITREDMDVTLMHNTSEGHANIAAAIQQFWMDNLGVNVTVENQEWKVYLDTIGNDTPLEEMPHIFRLGWCADYPDENNWVYEVFNADAGANRLRRGCVDDVCAEVVLQDFDNITEQAKAEQDPEVRKALYLEAETLLSEVEAAYIPIYFYTSVNVTKPELTRDFATVGHSHWYWWTLE